MRRLIVSVTFCIAATAILAGADLWETKPFMKWSDKELQQFITDSPWSRTVQVVMNTVARVGRGLESDRGGGSGGGGEEEEGGGGGGGRGRGDDGFGPPAPQVKLLVSWLSALPMKQAVVRGVLGLDGVIAPEDQQELDRDAPVYLIRVAGIPVRYAGLVAAMKGETFLKRGGSKPPIGVAELEAQENGTAVVVLFTFPKDDAIVVEDKDVEFVSKLGQFDVKKKFTLKDMVFKGKLEL